MAILKHQTRRGHRFWWLDEEILNTCEQNVSGLGDPVMSSQHVEKLDVGHPKIHSLKLKATTPERLGKRTCHLLAMNFQRFFALGFKEGTKHLLRYKGSNWETSHFREPTPHLLSCWWQFRWVSISRTSLNEPPNSTGSHTTSAKKQTCILYTALIPLKDMMMTKGNITTLMNRAN